MKVNITFVDPPIPDRNSDYCATFEGYEPGDFIGYGPTPNAAFEALMDAADQQPTQPPDCHNHLGESHDRQ
jgi:hypothetical protein